MKTLEQLKEEREKKQKESKNNVSPTGTNNTGGEREDSLKRLKAERAKSKIIDLYNSYSKQAESFYNDYNNRYYDADGNYIQKYRSDYAEWKSSAIERSLTLQKTNSELNSFLERYGQYYDKDFTSQLSKSLKEDNDYFKNVAQGATAEYDLLSKFKSENEYKAWDYSNTYRDSSYFDIQKEIADIEYQMSQTTDKSEAEEYKKRLDWLDAYLPNANTTEDYDIDVLNANKDLAYNLARDKNILQNNLYSKYLDEGKSDAEAKYLARTAPEVEEFNSKLLELGFHSDNIQKELSKAKMLKHKPTEKEVMSKSDFEEKSTYSPTVPRTVEQLKAAGYELNPGSDGDASNPYNYQYVGIGQQFTYTGEDGDLYTYLNSSADSELKGQVERNKRRAGEDYIKDGYHLMEEDEIKVYNYLYNTEGQESAWQYINKLRPTLQKRVLEEDAKKTAALVDESALHAIAGSAMSVGYNLIDSAAFIPKAAATLMGEYENYQWLDTYGNKRDAVRGTVGENLDENVGHLASMGYSGVMSIADMAAAMAIGAGVGGSKETVGKITQAIMSSSAGSSTLSNAKANGRSDGEALALGLGSAAIEWATEKYSVEKLLNNPSSIKSYLWQNFYTEALEEGTSNIANIALDDFISYVGSSKSDIQRDIDALVLNGGFTKEEAGKQVFMQRANAFFEDMAVGGFAGIGMAGGTLGIGAVSVKADEAKLSKQAGVDITNNKRVGELVTSARSTGDAKLMKLAEQVAGVDYSTLPETKKESYAKKVGKLYSQTLKAQGEGYHTASKTTVKGIVSEKLKANGVEESKIDKAADVIVKQIFESDKALTKAETKIFNEVDGTSIFNEIKDDKDIGIEVGKARKDASNQYFETASLTEEKNITPVDTSEYDTTDDGKTYVKDTGEEVAITGIASVNKGKMMVNLSNGQTENIKNLDISADEAIIYQGILDMNVDSSIGQFIAKTFKGSGMDANTYILGVKDAIHYGKIGGKSFLNEGIFTSELTEQMREDFYKLGEKYTRDSVAEKEQTIAKAIASNKGGKSVTGKVSFKGVNRNELNARQKVTVNAIEAAFGTMGIDVVFFNSPVNAEGKHIGKNGSYNPNTNTIELDISAGINAQDTILFTASHELTHFIKEWSPEKFEEFADFLVKQYHAHGVDVDALVKAKMEKLNLDYDTAFEEVVADSCESFLRDSNLMKTLTALAKQDLSLFERVGLFLEGLIEKLNKAYEGLTPDSRESREVLKMKDCIKELHDMWDEAALVARENFQNAGGKKTTSTNVKEQARPSKKDPRYLDPRTVTKNDVVEMLEGVKAGNYFDNTYIPIRATTPPALIYWAKEKLGDIIDDNPFMMSVSKAYASMARAGMDVDGNPHELSVPDMIALIEAMGDPQYIVFQTSNNRYVEVVSFVTESKKKVFAVIEIGNDKDTIYMNGYEGGLYNVLVTAYPPDAGKLQELLNHPKNKVIYDKQKDVSQRTSSSTVPSVLNDTPFFEDSITQPDGNFKENSEKKSERDNSGNQLTVEQAEYFKDSKVRDKNGNLMVMYHGTPNATFTKFKSGTYFTEHKEYADNYQNQGASSLSYKKTADNPDTYAVYLNITKPFDTRNKVERDIFYNEYYRQWGTGTDLMESGLPDWLDGGDLQEFLEEKGYDYDGLILDEGAVGGYGDEVISRGLSYVTFKPEQVKSVENKTPTDDSDYRFSYREELDDLNTQLKEKQNQIYSATMELKKFDSKAEQDKLYAVMDKEGVSQEEIDNALQAYSKWSTDSGYDDAFKKQSTLKDEERTLRREIQKIEDKLHDELKEQISHFSDEDVKKYVTKAVQKYHTTSRLENASYLLTTGSMLDFSDGQGYRVKDHREISEILDLPDYAEYSDGMIAFMNMGNIRLQTYGIDVSAMPNSKQFSALRDIISKVMREYDEFSVDFSKTDGYSAGSVTYGKGTATSKIVADIKSFFETGVVPEEQTGIRDFLYSMRDTSEGYAPAFYSKMGKTIDEIKQNKIGASSVIPYLTGKGVKAEEIKWSGIETFLEGKKSLTKEELQEFVKGSQLQIEESVLDNKMHSEVELKKVSKRKYDLYVDGKKTDTFTGNWKGDYWTTENSSSVFFSIDEISKWAKSKHTNKTRFQEYKLDGGENYRELLFSLPESSYTNLAMSAHWKQRTGILAHARIQDFDVNGKKMLFVEEIQSDWHNEGHKHGYREKGVKTQEEIGDESAKAYREFYEAVEGFIAKNGESVNPALLANLFYGEKEAYDFLQTNYNLSEEEMRYIDSEIAKETNRSVKFDTAPSIDIAPDAPFRDNYHEYVLKNLIRRAAEEGYDLIGWTPANIQSERWSDEFAEGYRIEYDQDIPKFLKKYGKQWGTTVGTTQIETGISSDFDREMAAKGYIDIEPNYTEVWSMDITDSMKNSVLYEGQVMYQERDPDAIAAYEKVVATLETENAKLTEDVERLKELVKLQRTETHNKVLTKSSVDAVAKSLMKYANAKGNRAELVKHLEDVYSYILQGENVSWEGVMEKAENAVDWLVRNEHIKTERDEYANTILKDLRTSRFYLDDLQKKEVAFRYGSYNEFRKKTMGRFILTDNAEMSLDSQWQVWAENYPGKFDASESSNNQPLKLMDIIDGLQEEIPVDYYGDAQMNRQDLLMSVYDGYWNVSTLTTFADRKQKEINNLKYKHKEQMSKLREDHNDKTLQLKKEYNEKLAKVREKSYEKQQAIAKHYQDARKKGIEDRNKTKVRGKIKSVVNELDKLLMRGNKDSNVKEDMQDVALAMLKSADAVFSTSFSNKKIVQGDISQMVLTAKEKNLVENYRDALESIDKTKAKIKELNESGTSDSKYLNKLYSNLNNYENLAKLYDNQLEDVFERERIRISKVTVPQALKELADAYKSIQKSEHAYISNVYNSAVAEMLDDLSTDEGMNRPFKEMSLEQLSEVYDAYKMVLTTIRDANKLFAFDKAITVEKLGMNARSEIEKIRTYNRSGLMRDFVKKYGWDALKPIYAFRNIGSDTLENLYRNIRKGEDVWYRDSKEAQLFQIEMKKNYGFNSWDLEKTYHFVSNNGKEFSLTLEQIMSLYALSRREQSLEHLIQGGIVLEDAVEVKESKTGKTYKVNTANTFTFSPELLNEVTKVVRENENMKGYVESMQEYLTKMGDKGNEVSMKLFGVRLFKEKVYFPIKSSDTYMNFKPEDVGEFKIKNSSFTKSTKKYANNPIVLNSFESVWGDHINDMALYHAFTLPLEDFTRVFNYRTRVDTELGQDAVRGALLNAYGKDAETYIRNLLKDLNGGVRSQNSTGLANKLISLGKKSSVFASASVTVQQPSAIARAFAHINPKYFANLKQFDLVHHNKAWEELKQYAPVAGIKEMGYFDTGLGQSSVDWIMQNNPEGFREGIKAFFSKDSAYRDEILSKAPALADELTWVAIWEATKKEVAETYDKNADDYLDKCGERFTEVIELTQVYDSVFSRSGYMRSKDVAVKMAVAFMAEPTTTMNMVYDSFVQNHRKTGKSNPAKVIPAVVASVFLNALLKALVTSGRDDDEDEAWIEKYLSATANSFVDDINPLTYIPYVKDVWSIFTGYDINRMDMTVIGQFADSIQDVFKDTVPVYKKVTGVIGAASSIFGVPLKNIFRDIEGVFTIAKSLGVSPTSYGVGEALLEGFTGKETTSKDRAWNAYKKGDTSTVKQTVNGLVEDKVKSGKTEKEAKSAVRSSFTNTYKEKYLEAVADKDYALMNEIRKFLNATGLYGSLSELDKTLTNWRTNK